MNTVISVQSRPHPVPFQPRIDADAAFPRCFAGPAAVVGDGHVLIAMNDGFARMAKRLATHIPRVGERLRITEPLTRRIDSARNRLSGSRNAEGKADIPLKGVGVLQVVSLRPDFGDEGSRWLWLLFAMPCAANPVAAFRGKTGLTETETAVLSHLVGGLSLREIAGTTGRSYGTIRWHVQNMLEKTGAGSQKDLIARFYREIAAA